MSRSYQGMKSVRGAILSQIEQCVFSFVALAGRLGAKPHVHPVPREVQVLERVHSLIYLPDCCRYVRVSVRACVCDTHYLVFRG